jgi:hypothetical protein
MILIKRIMNKILILTGTVLAFIALSFVSPSLLNSVVKSQTEVNGYTVTDHYFTLDNNINNKNSAAYIAAKPTLADIERAALTLPSDSFTVAKDGKVLLSVKLVHVPERNFIVSNPVTDQQKTVPCTLKGDMTAVRAIELADNKYDRKHSGIINGYLTFNQKKFSLIEHTAIQKEVMQIAAAELK